MFSKTEDFKIDFENLFTRNTREYTIAPGYVEIEMPGVKREDVTVELEDETLRVSWKDRKGDSRKMEFANAKPQQDPKVTLKDGILRIDIEGKNKSEKRKLVVE